MSVSVLLQSADEIANINQSFDLVYMDPPFGLQKDFFMLEEDGTKKSFGDHWNSFDDYIDWYCGIVELAYEKLNKDGWLYLHNNFYGNAMLLGRLDKSIRNNFYTNISWVRSGPKNNLKNGWGNIVDSILVFKKGSPYFEVEYSNLNPKYVENCFKNKDEKGYYALAKTTGEKSRPGRVFEYRGYNHPYGWRMSKERLDDLANQDLLHYGKKMIYKKIYLEDNKGVPVQNIWDDIYFISRSEKNKRNYPTQKPLKLLERIVKSSCPKGGWVLDPFCGSGTTAVASASLGRNCITSDINPDAVRLAKESVDDILCRGSLEDFFA